MSSELAGRNCISEQIGVLIDAANLYGLFDLLHELVDIIAQQTRKG